MRLREVTTELSRLHRELAGVEVAQAGARADAYRDAFENGARSVAEADRLATLRASDIHADVIKIRGDIESWREEKDYLTTFIGAL